MSYETELDDMVSVLTAENQQLKARIKELESSQQKWISVEEREPDDLNVVVCIDKKGRPKLTQSLGIENWQEYDNWFNEPTHWMPLPPPPTTEKSTADINKSLITEQTNEEK